MKTRASKFILFLVVLAMLVPTLFCAASAADAMPTTETEGIVDGGLYQIRNATVDHACLVYRALFHALAYEKYNDEHGPQYDKEQSFLFRVSYLGDGTYALIPMTWRTARLQADGERLTVALPNNSPEQRWYILPCEGGYEIRSAAGDHPAIGCIWPDFLSDAAGDRVWNFEPMPEMEETTNYIYVKAPAHWMPALSVPSYPPKEGAIWLDGVVMDPGEDGWYSFPNPNIEDSILIDNFCFRAGDQEPHPDTMEYAEIKPGKDCWIVIHDDPNIDGDLKLTVYDSKPENLPETADSAALAPAAAALIVSALALLMSVKLKPKEL